MWKTMVDVTPASVAFLACRQAVVKNPGMAITLGN
jgi:hypothetical protein